MRKRLFCFILAVVICAGLLAGCGGSSKLLGEWVAADGYAMSGFPDEMELFDDGTCIVDGFNGSFTTQDGRLKISALWSAMSFDYKVSGNKLTLDDGYDTVDYVRP